MALAVPSTDHAAGRILKSPHFRKASITGIPSCARRRIPAVICSHLSHGDQRRFRKYAANIGLAEHTGVFDHKPAGRALGHIGRGQPIDDLPHTSGIETFPMPPSIRKCGEKSETFDQTAIFDNKTAGKQGS